MDPYLKTNMDDTKEYVVLEHLMLPDRGFRFFTMNCRRKGKDPENPKENNTHGYTGELWYKEVGFADTIEEAQSMLSPSRDQIPTWDELYEYYRKESDRRDKEIMKRLEEDSK
jgi:hypothetical protein